MTPAWLVRLMRISLLNLVVVAIYGTLMRYKIAFDFPFLEQKHLLHAHSHFAFSGWVTHMLYCGLLYWLVPYLSLQRQKAYKLLLLGNLISAWGMLLAFTVQGYKLVSISFSTLSIIIAVIFCIRFIQDTRTLFRESVTAQWAVMGLCFHVFSSMGPFTLAWILASKQMLPKLYLASIYFYLHFQYNGWFFFGMIALLSTQFSLESCFFKKMCWVFSLCLFPTYFLSTLWADIPQLLYILTVSTALIQCTAWIFMLRKIIPVIHASKAPTPYKKVHLFLYASLLAISLKFLLQTVSSIPSLSQWVFGFRPIVIAYLHLVLLAGISIFLIAILFLKGYIHLVPSALKWAYWLLSGIVVNELLLIMQGLAGFISFPLLYINESLLWAAIWILSGTIGLLYFSRKPESYVAS